MKRTSIFVISVGMALCIYGIITVVVKDKNIFRNPPINTIDPNDVQPVLYDVAYEGLLAEK